MVGVALWLLKTPAGGRSNYVTLVTTAFPVAVAAALIYCTTWVHTMEMNNLYSFFKPGLTSHSEDNTCSQLADSTSSQTPRQGDSASVPMDLAEEFFFIIYISMIMRNT